MRNVENLTSISNTEEKLLNVVLQTSVLIFKGEMFYLGKGICYPSSLLYVQQVRCNPTHRVGAHYVPVFRVAELILLEGPEGE